MDDPTRLDTPFLEERDLPAQDQVLGDDRLARLESKGRELNQVGQQPQKESRQVDHEIMMPQAVLLGRAVPASNICGPQVSFVKPRRCSRNPMRPSSFRPLFPLSTGERSQTCNAMCVSAPTCMDSM
jgi:hypothetical protein